MQNIKLAVLQSCIAKWIILSWSKNSFPPPMPTTVLWMKIFLRTVSQGYLFLPCFEERCVLCVWEEWGRDRKETDNFKCKPQIICSSRGITDNVHVSKISGTLETEPTWQSVLMVGGVSAMSSCSLCHLLLPLVCHIRCSEIHVGSCVRQRQCIWL